MLALTTGDVYLSINDEGLNAAQVLRRLDLLLGPRHRRNGVRHRWRAARKKALRPKLRLLSVDVAGPPTSRHVGHSLRPRGSLSMADEENDERGRAEQRNDNDDRGSLGMTQTMGSRVAQVPTMRSARESARSLRVMVRIKAKLVL